MDNPVAHSIESAAKALGVSPSTIRRLIRERRLASVMVRRRRLIPTYEIERFVAALAVGDDHDRDA